MINGYLNGDYPTWLASMLDEWIPCDLLEKYGHKEMSTLNGVFWEVPEFNADLLANELRARRFRVERADYLEFA